jgi:hypothetical protein
VAFKAPFFSYDELRLRAESFLAQFHSARSVPVPIEQIIDVSLGMDIVPVTGLGNFDIVAYLSQDMKEIRVDEFVQRMRPNRYRFSLAHELAHKLLHADVFRDLRFADISGWKSLITNAIPEKEYRYLEFQASSLAGLILAPSAELRTAFFDVVEPAQEQGIDFDDVGNGARDAVEDQLAKVFEVSAAVIHRRIEFDGLWH